jgi:hypothetical protein
MLKVVMFVVVCGEVDSLRGGFGGFATKARHAGAVVSAGCVWGVIIWPLVPVAL